MLRRNIGVKKVYNAYCKAEELLFSFLFAVMVALVFSSAVARKNEKRNSQKRI